MEENLRIFIGLHSKLLLPFTHSLNQPGCWDSFPVPEFLTHEFWSQDCWGARTFPDVLRRMKRGHINMCPVSGQILGWRLYLPFPLHHTQGCSWHYSCFLWWTRFSEGACQGKLARMRQSWKPDLCLPGPELCTTLPSTLLLLFPQGRKQSLEQPTRQQDTSLLWGNLLLPLPLPSACALSLSFSLK